MTDRHTINTITDNDLNQLYDRVAKAEEDTDVSVAAAAHLTTLVGKRSEKAERTAKGQRLRADIAETELRVLRSGLRAIGGDPTQIQNLWAQIRLRNRQWREEKQRAERAEVALARVRHLVTATAATTATGISDYDIGRHDLATEVAAALDEPAPAERYTGLVVQPYRNDHGQPAWVFRCWGTDRCDGWLSLDHTSQESAERARNRHIREEHTEPGPAATQATKEQPMPTDKPTCTATIEGPHVLGGGPITCTRQAGHPETHVGPNPDSEGRTLWTDHHAGATPHSDREAQPGA